MEIVRYPLRSLWPELARRPALSLAPLQASVLAILDEVKRRGDEALLKFTERFDGVSLSTLSFARANHESGQAELSLELARAIELAKHNIERFHAAQRIDEPVVEISAGVRCWRRTVPIERVGLYIPGGSAVLFSTALMLGVPAKLAGCREIVVCTPPTPSGGIAPALLYALELLEIEALFTVGGAQAIAAMAYGTESIPRVDKIFGPGNQYVTCAKQLVFSSGEVSIDLPAGPTEQLVIADRSVPASFIAADLLSQAEHGPDSQVMLVSCDESVLQDVGREIERQLESLPRRDIALSALEKSRAILFRTLDEAIDFANFYAPEHLLLSLEDAQDVSFRVSNAGSVFLGAYTPESVGDYASGTNHTLPTSGFARSQGGVSLESFLKRITFQEITREGLSAIGPAVEVMAEAEGLIGHARAVRVRMEGA